MTARELGTYVQAAWATYEDMREQRDEALTRVQELTDQVERLRDLAVALEQDCAAWRRITLAYDRPDGWCPNKDGWVQCSLTAGHDGACLFMGIIP